MVRRNGKKQRQIERSTNKVRKKVASVMDLLPLLGQLTRIAATAAAAFTVFPAVGGVDAVYGEIPNCCSLHVTDLL